MFTFDGMSVKMCNVHHNKVTSVRQRIVQCSFKKNTNYQREENYLLLWLSKCKIILNFFGTYIHTFYWFCDYILQQETSSVFLWRSVTCHKPSLTRCFSFRNFNMLSHLASVALVKSFSLFKPLSVMC